MFENALINIPAHSYSISVARLSGGSACYAGPVCVCLCVRVQSPHTQQIRTHSVALCEWQQRDSRRIKENDGPPLSFLSDTGGEEAAG